MANLVQITAASYSRYSDYKKCPLLAKFKHVEKRREPDSPALANGSRIHALCSQYIGGDLRKLPAELAKFDAAFAKLRKVKASCEQEWAFDKNWKSVDWFARDAWLRVKMDAFHVAIEGKEDVVRVIDFKTGREYPDHRDQRELYAIGAFLKAPQAARVVVDHWYLDSGNSASDIFDRALHFEVLQKKWVDSFKPMLTDKIFKANPGNHCRFCFFRKSNGGPCKF